ncbi:thiol peroxidase [Lactobacillus xylocopicola]|uniref:2-Cys peroxiredoxin n=1 Tax=Lactobacillus xylocopicola TaxID=2976676 RepID=A0ABM8BH15_9LACO|nr:thiol peroxidase [Lactobacillus xylocopicola]BDR60546.1 2-Cys peroxiredoxin [Lactobacillus xylocopicola]
MQITMRQEKLATNGQPPLVGDQLPDFNLTVSDGSVQRAANLITKPTLISVVPNINTSVCSISTKRFNGEVDKYDGINFYTISTNTTDEQKNWCAAEGVKKMKLLSDKELDFGKKMGLYVEAAGIDARSIWIVDADRKVLYQELIQEMTNEPNYDAALTFLDSLK